MYIANSRTITIRFFKRSITDMLRKRKRNYISIQIKPQKAEKEWKKKRKNIRATNRNSCKYFGC